VITTFCYFLHTGDHLLFERCVQYLLSVYHIYLCLTSIQMYQSYFCFLLRLLGHILGQTALHWSTMSKIGDLKYNRGRVQTGSEYKWLCYLYTCLKQENIKQWGITCIAQARMKSNSKPSVAGCNSRSVRNFLNSRHHCSSIPSLFHHEKFHISHRGILHGIYSPFYWSSTHFVRTSGTCLLIVKVQPRSFTIALPSWDQGQV